MLWPIPKTVLNQWATRYYSFARERFARFSRGGGNWKPLKRRRRRGALSRASILIDTGTLFGSLGQYRKFFRDGVEVGYSGPARHPKAGMTVARLAAIHNFGLGNMPQREIIVEPPKKVVDAMADDVVRHWKKALK